MWSEEIDAFVGWTYKQSEMFSHLGDRIEDLKLCRSRELRITRVAIAIVVRKTGGKKNSRWA